MRLAPIALLALLLLAGCAATKEKAGTASTQAPSGTTQAPAPTPQPHQNGTRPVVSLWLDATPVLSDLQHPGAENGIGVDPKGRVFVEAPVLGTAPRSDVLRSDDGGRTWRDVSPHIQGQRTHPTTTDPIFAVDQRTGRLFMLDLLLACNELSTSDDGGDTWSTPGAACPFPGGDHPTLGIVYGGAGLPGGTYPNAVVVCYNQVAATECGRSLDGGVTFAPMSPPFSLAEYALRNGPATSECSGLTGHVKGDFAGNVYLPNGSCSPPAVAVSRDGATWQVLPAADDETNGIDPAVAADQDGAVLYAYTTKDGQLRAVASADAGVTWSQAFSLMAPNVTAANLPAVTGGLGGRFGVFYYGSSVPGGYRGIAPTGATKADNVTWDAYFAYVEDATGEHPTVRSVRLNPAEDPVYRGICGPGRCPPAIYDFMDITTDGDGRPWIVYADGCHEACAMPGGKASDSTWEEAFVATLATGPSLLDGKPLVPIHGAMP